MRGSGSACSVQASGDMGTVERPGAVFRPARLWRRGRLASFLRNIACPRDPGGEDFEFRIVGDADLAGRRPSLLPGMTPPNRRDIPGYGSRSALYIKLFAECAAGLSRICPERPADSAPFIMNPCCCRLALDGRPVDTSWSSATYTTDGQELSDWASLFSPFAAASFPLNLRLKPAIGNGHGARS